MLCKCSGGERKEGIFGKLKMQLFNVHWIILADDETANIFFKSCQFQTKIAVTSLQTTKVKQLKFYSLTVNQNHKFKFEHR